MLELGSISSSLFDVEEEEVGDAAEFTWSVIVTDVFLIVGIFRCIFVDWSESPPILRFLDRVNGPPPFLAEVVEFNNGAELIMSILEDDSDGVIWLEEEVKSTGEQDGGRVVIVETSIATDVGVLRRVVSSVLLDVAVEGILPWLALFDMWDWWELYWLEGEYGELILELLLPGHDEDGYWDGNRYFEDAPVAVALAEDVKWW